MIHAYPVHYLDSAMRNVGDLFDYGLREAGLTSASFQTLFLTSRVCGGIETGNTTYLVGKSGLELFQDCYRDAYGKDPEIHFSADFQRFEKSPEYWAGWALTFYQWQSGRPYGEILRAISLEEIISLYPAHHEADVSRFADTMEEIFRRRNPNTRLKIHRQRSGFSQRELAAVSGVSLRSIQMYEQRQKDINKAQAGTLHDLAVCLSCRMEDLLEPA